MMLVFDKGHNHALVFWVGVAFVDIRVMFITAAFALNNVIMVKI